MPGDNSPTSPPEQSDQDRMVGWEPGKRGLTIGMIKQAGEAMLAAAAGRRRGFPRRTSRDSPHRLQFTARSS
jgi:hypothetical protein